MRPRLGGGDIGLVLAVAGTLLGAVVVLVTARTRQVMHRQKAPVRAAVEEAGAFWGCWHFPTIAGQSQGGPLTMNGTELR